MSWNPASTVRVVLVVTAIALVLALVLPFASALLFAAVLAAALQGVCDRMTRWFWGRRHVAAGVITFVVLVGGLLPLAFATVVAVEETVQGVKFVRETLTESGVDGLVGHLPGFLREPANRLFTMLDAQSGSWISAEGTSRAASFLGDVVATTSRVLLQVALMLIMLFFLLAEGSRLVDWADRVGPLPRGEVRGLLAEFRVVTRSVLVSSLVTSLVQSVAATVGFLIAGVPHPMFFAIVTFVFSFVPAIGAGGVCLALAGLLVLLGSPGYAIFLALWGMVVVGVADNVVRPWVIKGGAQLHGAVIFFALIGGIAAFGPVGLVAGPLIVVFFSAVTKPRNQVPSAT